LKKKIDPFDLRLLNEALNAAAKLFVQKSSLLFCYIHPDQNFVTTKETSTNAVIDTLPKITDIRRLAQIPRLSQISNKHSERALDARPRKSQKRSPSPNPKGARVAQPLTSLYNKFSEWKLG